MNKIQIILVFLGFFSINCLAEELILDLNTAVDIALENNFSLLEVSKDTRIAHWAERVALSSYLPQANLLFSASDVHDHPYISYSENYQLDLTLTQSIFDLKKIKDISASSFFKKYQDEYYKSYYQFVIFNTIQFFYCALLAQENLNLRKKALSLAEEESRIANIRYQEGIVSYYDLLRAQTNYLTSKAELKNAQAEYQKTLYELKNVLGISPEKVIKLQGEFSFDYKEVNIDTVVDDLLTFHPQISACNYLVRMARAELNSARVEFLPKVSLEIVQSQAKRQALSPSRQEWDDYWIGYLKVSLPIFEGGRRYFQIKQAGEELQKTEIQRLSLINEIKKEVNCCYQDYISFKEIVKSQEENLKKAEELYLLVKDRYINGQASEIEFLDAHLNLISTELAFKQARCKAIISYYGILYYSGRISKEWLNLTLDILQ